ncbi:MAG: hypothetical protein ABSG97_03875 [Sedimentisphaerales bacterium]|jgi:hypothetical protein
MNEEKLKQILNEIGRTDIPPSAALIAERASRNISAVLKIEQPKHRFITAARFVAAAALVVLAFYTGLSVGRHAKPLPLTENIVAYKTSNANADSFWQQKAIAAMQSRPTVQTDISYTEKLNAYKQYLKEKRYE